MNSPLDISLFERINAALPQTQCTRCGYPDCAAYAQAIADGRAAINQCPPGGAEGIHRLSRITGLPATPLNPANGSEGPRAVAVIDEAWCIGCTLCIKACPTDAILGSNKLMHTMIEPYCTGCELCVPVCPVDCISLENVTGTHTGWSAWSQPQAQTARARHALHSVRQGLKKNKHPETLEFGENPEYPAQPQALTQPAQALAQPSEALTPPRQPEQAAAAGAERKRAMIEAALARSRAQREKKF